MRCRVHNLLRAAKKIVSRPFAWEGFDACVPSAGCDGRNGCAALVGASRASAAQAHCGRPQSASCATWYRLVLELVRHTPTYSPPVASRAFAYLGVTAFEAVGERLGRAASLAGQLNGLHAVPQRAAGQDL